ncbi:hypothetical protein HK105_209512 [Polyrhizophydium stewartii]|uniref:Strictosidine synthase conserved region domain-containing protein n=1 Tax=Polyrhizophydium stewartii TaxID=2732419 RepID=A0ABR4MUV9_9FUNG
MRVFKPRKSHTLKMLGELKLPFSVDNIALDAQSGDFYLTGFGNILSWREHVHDHSAKSPSAIIRVSHNTEQDQYYGRRYRVERLMVEDGSKASGATVAIPDRATQRLFIGGVFMHGILVCNLPPRK